MVQLRVVLPSVTRLSVINPVALTSRPGQERHGAVLKQLLRVVLAVLMVTIGIAHFVRPQPFVDIIPAALPFPLALVYASGLAEMLGGAGLLVPRTRRLAAWGLVALYVAVFPANINMTLNQIAPSGADPLPVWALWARLPFQLVLVAWAYWNTREPQPASDSSSVES